MGGEDEAKRYMYGDSDVLHCLRFHVQCNLRTPRYDKFLRVVSCSTQQGSDSKLPHLAMFKLSKCINRSIRVRLCNGINASV